MEIETKKEVENLIAEKAKGAAEAYIKDHGADYVKSAEAQKFIKNMLIESFDDFKVKHADNDVTLADYVNTMQKQFDEMALLLKDTKAAVKETFEQSLQKQLTGVKAQLVGLKDTKKSDWINLEIKAAATMLISSNYTGTYALTDWDPGFARIQRRQPYLRQLVTVRPTSGMYVAWAEQANPDGTPAWTAEGALKSQIDFDIVERSQKVEKLTAFIKISKEMLADIPFMNAEIRQELIELINLKLDADLLSGSGTSPVIKGILNFAIPTFAVPSGVALLTAPNRYDVIKVAVTQIMVANFMPDYIIVNPVDAANMELVKDTQGRYLLPPFSTTNGTEIAGVRVVANNGVPAGTFLVGDFKRDVLAMREELNISIGYENDDFTKNLVTVLAELRAVNYIKTNYLNAFVKGSFSTAITALTTV